mmetsp:Transcript_16504/g.25504  ORF Transcript_16504/g.25504 Transcript_16504/m.25504 type:complete len:288 (+) Transcript_16504:162-1025(+)|eukprot:CAMPEP_0170513362 /NCGR_PEP_ID=MMETSP0208-20121228/67359_1 /TAXON_ID=197538 /ORGANISM="Strombidium inclinatum, Strain S3" /LENGTH=287 /DNA_ID=CAMNT_0010797087 /DNA_START=677 /DNA_END=1540 /DNA_ORIENTATION=-
MGLMEFYEMYQPDLGMLPPLNFLLSILVFAFFEIRFRRLRKMKIAPAKNHLPVILEEEFEKRVEKGEQLVVLDDLILDVKEYASVHPGGEFLLSRNIGRDISKFYYGGYALDGNSDNPKNGKGRKVHGTIPDLIVHDLAIAIFKQPSDITLDARIEQKEAVEVIKGVKTFRFKSEDSKGMAVKNLKDYYPDVGYIGRHFLVTNPEIRSEGLPISRHYTISNVMQPNQMQSVLAAVKQGVETGSCSPLSDELLDSTDQPHIHMTLKNYSSASNGLSGMIFSATAQTQF